MARKIKVDVELNPSNMDEFLNKLESKTEAAFSTAFKKAQQSERAHERYLDKKRREREEEEKASREEERKSKEHTRRIRSIGSAIGGAITGITKVVGLLVGVAGRGVGTIGRMVGMSANAMNSAIGNVTNVITQSLSSAQGILSQIPVVGNVLSIPLSVGKAGVSAVSSVSRGVIGGLGSGVGGALQGVGSAVIGAGGGIASLGGSLGGGIAAGSLAGGPIGAVIGGVLGLVNGVFTGGAKLANGAMGGATSIFGGALKGVTGLVEGLTSAVMQAPILIEDTARKLIRTMLTLAASFAGFVKLAQRDTTERMNQSNKIYGSFSANPLGTLREPYTRRMELYRQGLKYYKEPLFNVDDMLSASERIQENIQDTMTGQGFSDRFAIDENWVLERIGLGKKYNLRDMLTNGQFDSFQFVEDVMRSIEANPYALLNDTILREAVENIIGKNNVGAAVGSANEMLTTGRVVSMFDLMLGLGVGKGTTLPTKNMAEFQRAMAKLSGTFDEAGRNIFESFLPALTKLVDKLSEYVNEISGKINNFLLEKNGKTIIDEFKEVFSGHFGGLEQFKSDLSSSFSYISDYFKYLTDAIGETIMAIIGGIKESLFGDVKTFEEYKSKFKFGNFEMGVWGFDKLKLRFENLMNVVPKAVKNSKLNQSSMRFDDLNTSLKSVWYGKGWGDFIYSLGNQLWHGDVKPDIDDIEESKGVKLSQEEAQRRADRLKNSGKWYEFAEGLFYSNYPSYKGMTNTILEKIVKESMENAGISTDGLFGKDQPLDTNRERGVLNLGPYLKWVDDWFDKNKTEAEKERFQEEYFKFPVSMFASYMENAKSTVRLNVGHNASKEIIIRADYNSDTTIVDIVKKNITNGG